VLSDEERRAKEKRMIEIKKMLTIQSCENFNPNNIKNESSSLSSPYEIDNTNHVNDVNYEKEKKEREHVKHHANNLLLNFI
jgi:hypothetical protein